MAYTEPKKNQKNGLGDQSTDRPKDYSDNGPFYKQGSAKGCGDSDAEAIRILQDAAKDVSYDKKVKPKVASRPKPLLEIIRAAAPINPISACEEIQMKTYSSVVGDLPPGVVECLRQEFKTYRSAGDPGFEDRAKILAPSLSDEDVVVLRDELVAEAEIRGE